MQENIRTEITRLLSKNDIMDIEIRLVRPMGEPVMLYNFEKDNVNVHDDYIEFYENNRKRKVLYKNIIRIEWRTLFPYKPVKEVIDGDYNMKESVSAYGQSENNNKSDDSA